MMVVDEDGVIRFANPAAASLLNREDGSLVGSLFGLPAIGHQRVELDIHRGRGEMGVAELSSCPVQWGGQPAHLVTFEDVTERYRAMEAMRYQARHDALTALPNRLQFLERLEEAVARATREGGNVSVLFMDLDRFKEVNDTLGHAAGDELLRVIANRLSEAVRKSDLVARMSGDEFAIVLEGIGDPGATFRVAEKVRSAIAAPVDLEGEAVFPSCTIGVSLFPEDGTDAKTLLARADTAMFKAKDQGRNRAYGFAIEQEEETSRRFQLDQGLQQAWQEGGFHLVYQPQVVLPAATLAGAEALLRCQAPGMGEVGPDEFVPLLEETGLIHRVGLWVFQEAAKAFGADGVGAGMPGRLWVNVSVKQLGTDHFLTSLDRLIDDQSIDPNRFGIELTESMLAGNVSDTARVLVALRQRGFAIAMDDFGKGYSALTYLHTLPLDLVKVDKAFVQGLTEDGANRKLVRAIAAMAHNLDLPVLAEGVETPEQLEILIEENFDFAQGYLFSTQLTASGMAEVPRGVDLGPGADQYKGVD